MLPSAHLQAPIQPAQLPLTTGTCNQNSSSETVLNNSTASVLLAFLWAAAGFEGVADRPSQHPSQVWYFSFYHLEEAKSASPANHPSSSGSPALSGQLELSGAAALQPPCAGANPFLPRAAEQTLKSKQITVIRCLRHTGRTTPDNSPFPAGPREGSLRKEEAATATDGLEACPGQRSI